MLIEALNKRNISAESRAFPDRTTCIGLLINSFLSKKLEIPPETAHLLFSANRWECKDDILKTLHSGTTIVVDRYAGSGAAYTAATTGKPLSWCKEPDRGLPSPDTVIFLKVSDQYQQLRGNWGDERFESIKLQQHVAANYQKLMDKTWYIQNADEDKLLIHSQILEKVLSVIDRVKDQPVGQLYESPENS
ncbi:thymidylate kinase isoform X2 [Xylocopa sonorina]